MQLVIAKIPQRRSFKKYLEALVFCHIYSKKSTFKNTQLLNLLSENCILSKINQLIYFMKMTTMISLHKTNELEGPYLIEGFLFTLY